MSNNNRTIGIDVLSDEEFYAMKDKEEKERFLDNLLSAQESSTRRMGFSVKSVKPKEEKPSKKIPKLDSHATEEPSRKSSVFRRKAYESGIFDDSEWGALLDRIDEINGDSPIEDVTGDEIHKFGKTVLDTLGPVSQDEAPSRYDNMFKRELAMYSEILRDTNRQAKAVQKKIDDMSKKSTYGVSKYYADMVEQLNSLNNTKVTIVKQMADLRSKIEDFKLKQLKTEGATEQGVDELVDQYYKTIMNGGRAEFISKSLMSQSPYDSDQDTYQSMISGNYHDDSGAIPKAEFTCITA